MWDGRFVGEWRRHQAEALAAFEASHAGDDHNHYVVMPPGAGKTHVGLEIARRLGRDTLVLCPNTAIQAQWMRAWRDFQSPISPPAAHDTQRPQRPTGMTPTASRELPTPLTVLTYQSVATFDPDAEVDPEGREKKSPHPRGITKTALLERLHENGQALVERLRTRGPWTLVLDECHHLLDVWGHLLVDLIGYIANDELTRVVVIGLTATPATRLTTQEHAIVRELFGDLTYSVSTPAVVKTGHIAPYQELVMLTEPTEAERYYIKAAAERFAELVTDLTAGDFGTTPFLAWCDRRFVARPVPESQAPVGWDTLERQEPELAGAAVRLHVAGLLEIPPGARVREEHRRGLDAKDWAVLIGDWVRGCLAASTDQRDDKALDALRRALPSVGYQVTKRGVRVGRSPVDRVLARSAGKATAVLDILGVEHAALGDRLRAIVVCDFERATGQVSASLRHVMDEQAGSARLVFEQLIRDPATAALDPILMTARTVACTHSTANRLDGWLRVHHPDLNLDRPPLPTTTGLTAPVELSGRWSARQRVGLITRFFEEGHSRILVGTRGLLGEGWDAKRVNVVIDLTTATTSTAVVQLRGRGVRVDPTWPEKVANTWTVVTVADGHPKGAADYARFVAKHDGFFAPDGDGQITSGVAHVDATLSPYGPPPPSEFPSLNMRMRSRAQERELARQLWRIGQPYEDKASRVLRILTARHVGLTGSDLEAVVPPWRSGLNSQKLPAVAALVVGLLGFVIGAAAALPAWVVGAAGVVPTIFVYGIGSGLLALARLRTLDRSSSLWNIAAAIADGLHAAGVIGVTGAVVEVTPRSDGSYVATLRDAAEQDSATFADALDQVLSPLASPRYVVSRPIINPPLRMGAALHLALRRAVGVGTPGAEVWHAVPDVLASRRERAEAFLKTWRRWVAPGRLVYVNSPEGAGILAAQRGNDPFDTTAAIRTTWH